MRADALSADRAAASGDILRAACSNRNQTQVSISERERILEFSPKPTKNEPKKKRERAPSALESEQIVVALEFKEEY